MTTSARPCAGVCVGAQISILPSLNCAVQFCGSSGACAMNGNCVRAFDDLHDPFAERAVGVAVGAQRERPASASRAPPRARRT